VRGGLPLRGRHPARRRGPRRQADEGHRRAARRRGRHDRRRHAAEGARGDALEHYPLAEVSGHFHDTYGQALSNILECLQLGVHTFDASVSGLGGCPYAKGATGNVATEDVVYLLHGLGIRTGIDLDKLVDAGRYIREAIGKPNGSRVARALLAKRGVAVEAGCA